jgi:guanylate kinase
MKSTYCPTIFVISGPSGVGKSSIAERVLKEIEELNFSISTTTREPRNLEKDGVDYYFISEDKFKELIDEDAFLEYARVHKNYYGTLRTEIEKSFKSGFDILLDIDVQGAKQLKDKIKEGVYIFIIPPSIKELRERIFKREGSINNDYEMRLNVAIKELNHIDDYDYVVINDNLEDAKNSVKYIIFAERLRRSRNAFEFNGK